MCELSEEEKLRARPIILDGDALDYFSSKMLPQSSSYDQCCRKVTEHYTFEEKGKTTPTVAKYSPINK